MGSFVEANWWLYFVLCVGIFLTLSINAYVIILWQHPDDKNESYFAKLLVLVGLSIAELCILFLPLDVANNGNSVDCSQSWSSVFCGVLHMNTAWQAMFIIIFILALFVIPYAIFFYEEDDSEIMTGTYNPWPAFATATKYMIAMSGMVLFVLLMMFYFLGMTVIPVTTYSISGDTVVGASHIYTINAANGQTNAIKSSDMSSGFDIIKEQLKAYVSFPIYVVALMAWVGWFMFAVFGGLGLTAIPIDLLRGFIHRPKQLDRAQVAMLETDIASRCEELLDIGQLLQQTRLTIVHGALGVWQKQKKKRQAGGEFKKFKQMVYVLEKDFDMMVICKDYTTKNNPVTPYLWLLCGIFSLCVALLWIVQMVLYMLMDPPLTPFLNRYFIYFDTVFPLFGIMSIFVMSLYLFLSCTKGCFKYGMRLGFLTLHPMKVNETYMHSFLFNIGIILMCTPAMLQFITQAFQAYVIDANINNIFNVQVRYLKFFVYFFDHNVFVFCILILSILSGLYLLMKPSDDPLSTKKIRETLDRIQHAENAPSSRTASPTRPLSRAGQSQASNKA